MMIVMVAMSLTKSPKEVTVCQGQLQINFMIDHFDLAES